MGLGEDISINSETSISSGKVIEHVTSRQAKRKPSQRTILPKNENAFHSPFLYPYPDPPFLPLETANVLLAFSGASNRSYGRKTRMETDTATLACRVMITQRNRLPFHSFTLPPSSAIPAFPRNSPLLLAGEKMPKFFHILFAMEKSLFSRTSRVCRFFLRLVSCACERVRRPRMVQTETASVRKILPHANYQTHWQSVCVCVCPCITKKQAKLLRAAEGKTRVTSRRRRRRFATAHSRR